MTDTREHPPPTNAPAPPAAAIAAIQPGRVVGKRELIAFWLRGGRVLAGISG